MLKHYKKYFKAVKTTIDVIPNKEGGYKEKGAEKYKFRESHPRYNFSHLKNEESYYTQNIIPTRKTMFARGT